MNAAAKFYLVWSSNVSGQLFWPPAYITLAPVLSEGGCPLHWDPQYDGVLY